MMESDFTIDESFFIRETITEKLSELNIIRQQQSKEAATSGDLVATLFIEERVRIAESAWEKLKGLRIV